MHLHIAQVVEEPERTGKIDQRVDASEVVEVERRLWKIVKPRLRATQALERAQGGAFALVGDLGSEDGGPQIRYCAFNTIEGVNDDPRAARVPALLVPDVDADLVSEAKGLDGGVKQVAIGAGVEQRAERHVAGDSREAVEISDGHARVLLMCTAAASIGDMLAGRLATRTVTALAFGNASTPAAIRVASVSINFTGSPSIVSLAIARTCL